MSPTPSPGDILVDLLVILVAAKAVAEIAERAGLPAVAGEMVAGVLVGPSVLGLVEPGPVLSVLGELGIVLLLLDVGLKLDIAHLGSVARPATAVAVAGTACTLAVGWAATIAVVHSGDTALFLAAAVTATSLGISARVFADLGRLATLEARTVLAAAVVDDVIGLVTLTVVARVVTGGDLSPASVVGTVALAVGYLVVAGITGVRLAAPLFRGIERLARGPGTPLALALAFSLALAALADAAGLAPLIGAFVAGLALARTDQCERVQRDLTPIGHVLIPVFFLRVGVDADLGAVVRPEALGLAAVLVAAAVAAKVVCGFGAVGSRADRLALGFGMVPRGEVGLVFAGLGLREGILDQPRYGALLVTILATDLVGPVLLRRRLRRLPPGGSAG
ncbi:MAG TPA: cation:proton antiporter [Acidimicrobiia bacterium]|jgi:Kef-type K+ transport system membrane component KefB